MIDFFKRLKEERERLGLSQAKFAEACGVGKTAQYTYERGDREPSWAYMEAAEKIGVDTLYVFTGTRTGKDWAYARAYSKLLYTIEMSLGLEEGRLELLCKECVALDDRLGQLSGSGGSVHFGDWQDAVIAWLGTSTKPDRCIDPILLAPLLEAVEQSATKISVFLPTEKRLRVALMLYRDAKALKSNRFPELSVAGTVSQDAIDTAVKLAAG